MNRPCRPLPIRQIIPAKPWMFWIGAVLVILGAMVAILSFTQTVQKLDQQLLFHALAHRSSFANAILVAPSILFKPVHTLIIAIIVGGGLSWWFRRWQIAAYLVGAVIWAAVIGYAIKFIAHRQRPKAQYFLVHADGYSMPSGHTLEITAFLFALLCFAWRVWGHKYRLSCLFGSVGAVLLTVIVAYSRIYTANHWASDTIAGALLGLGAGMTAIVIIVVLPAKPSSGRHLR